MRTQDHPPGTEMQRCLKHCQRCHSTCLEMAATYCLEMGGKHADPAHLRLMLDCAQICQTSADFMLRDSDLHAPVCLTCAVICECCAESCEEVGGLEYCAQACYTCAESCRAVGHAVA